MVMEYIKWHYNESSDARKTIYFQQCLTAKVGMMLSIDIGSMGFISIMKEHYSITEFLLLLLNVLFYESILALLDLF